MLGFIVAVIGGLVVQPAEDILARPIARFMAPMIKIEAEEMRAFSFALVLLIVTIIAWLLHSGSAFWLIVGAILGLFGKRLFDWLRARIEKKADR